MNKTVSRPVVLDSAERRNHHRRIVDSDSTLRDPNGRPLSVLVRDLSVHGFAAECNEELVVGTTITLGLPGFGSAQAVIVRRDDKSYGCQFIEQLAPAAFTAAFGPSNVVVAPFRTIFAPVGTLSEPEIEPWSVSARVRLMIGGSIILWALALTLL